MPYAKAPTICSAPTTGGEGFRLALEHAPDLLISDIDMPVMNGYEMCQRIKETESTRGIPILILSARGAGIDDFLTKTVADNELLSRIEMTLDSALASANARNPRRRRQRRATRAYHPELGATGL